MTDQKRIDFYCTYFEAKKTFGERAPMSITADLRPSDADDLLCTLAADIGFKRVCELLEIELREALDTRSDAEERWADHAQAEREDRRIR